MKSRWTIYLEGETRQEKREGLDTVPVLDINCKGEVVSQIGLNVPHIKSDEVYFPKLRGNFSSVEGTIEDWAVYIFAAVHGIMFVDPSISSFTFTRLNDFRLHVSDSGLIKALDQDQTTHTLNRAYYMLKRAEFKPTVQILNELTADPENYPIFLSYLTPKERPPFHEALLKLADEQSTKKIKAELVMESVHRIDDEIEKLRGNVKTYHLEKALERIRKETERGKTVAQERLTHLYDAFTSKPFQSETKMLLIPCFSNVQRMPTTLHERANEGYSPGIVSYRATESYHNLVATGEEGIRRTRGFRERLRILEQRGQF